MAIHAKDFYDNLDDALFVSWYVFDHFTTKSNFDLELVDVDQDELPYKFVLSDKAEYAAEYSRIFDCLFTYWAQVHKTCIYIRSVENTVIFYSHTPIRHRLRISLWDN